MKNVGEMGEEQNNTDYKPLRNQGSVRGSSHVNMSSGDFTYEHFPVVCPTCEGTGSIEEDAGHMVTFVPVKDERLRPAWTKVKIVALIVIIMVVGGCTTYFLYPRTVTIQVILTVSLLLLWLLVDVRRTFYILVLLLYR